VSQLRVLLVGAGWAARRHIEGVIQSRDSVGAVVEPDASRTEALVQRLGAEVFASLSEWEAYGPAVDAAVIASPSSEHLGQALALVRRGVPVLVEKPHRLPGEDAADLLAESRRIGVPVQIGMSTRYRAGMQTVRRALASGTLGEPVWITDRIWFELGPDQLSPWYFDPRSSGGGVLVTNGVHALDRVSWLLGEQLELERAQLRTLMAGGAVEDAAMLQLSTASGVSVVISLLWAPFAVPESVLRVVAGNGTAAVRADGSWNMSISGRPQEGGEAEPELAAFARQWQAFRAAILDGEPVEADLDAAEHVLATIEAAYASRPSAWLS
jgi:predicted dehydrogenase